MLISNSIDASPVLQLIKQGYNSSYTIGWDDTVMSPPARLATACPGVGYSYNHKKTLGIPNPKKKNSSVFILAKLAESLQHCVQCQWEPWPVQHNTSFSPSSHIVAISFLQGALPRRPCLNSISVPQEIWVFPEINPIQRISKTFFRSSEPNQQRSQNVPISSSNQIQRPTKHNIRPPNLTPIIIRRVTLLPQPTKLIRQLLPCELILHFLPQETTKVYERPRSMFHYEI
jgi:hypothetical protein